MKRTAAVINAGIGSLTLGLQQAGFEVISAYETDTRAATIHRNNLDVPVQTDSLPGFWQTLPTMPDVIAAQLPDASRPEGAESLQLTLDIIDRVRPVACLLLLAPRSMQDKQVMHPLLSLLREHYHITSQILDVKAVTGCPIEESIGCILALRSDLAAGRSVPAITDQKALLDPALFLEDEADIDPWYRKIDPRRIADLNAPGRYLCWKGQMYVSRETLRWNNVRIPLVKSLSGPRRITPRELAMLKGLPSTFQLDTGSKTGMYRALADACNASLARILGESLRPMLLPLSGGPSHFRMFYDLFQRYLLTLVQQGQITLLPTPGFLRDLPGDFLCKTADRALLFELKTYSGRSASAARLLETCHQLTKAGPEVTPVLVAFNIVHDHVKRQCHEQFGVTVWDVSNLLWQFRHLPELHSELIASLSYSVDDLLPTPPFPDVLAALPEPPPPEKKPTFADLLQAIVPGLEQAAAYEPLCTEMLKYILGDSLTLWRTQERSNDGLYRFDLCCKIKTGTEQDFFDTVKHYFNTKYIVFEFKNYTEPITQKEIYTTEKYLYEKALRKVAIIIARRGADEHAVWAAKGALRENGKLILCLNDGDLLQMARMKEDGEQDPADYLSDMLDTLLVQLEK